MFRHPFYDKLSVVSAPNNILEPPKNPAKCTLYYGGSATAHRTSSRGAVAGIRTQTGSNSPSANQNILIEDESSNLSWSTINPSHIDFQTLGLVVVEVRFYPKPWC
jgi:hypothetical protein